MFKISRQEFQIGTQTCILETGKIARQADGAVVIKLGKSTVLCTVVGAKEASPNQSFFPLTVNYQERYYAGGRIPGGFFKREGRPTEKETLTSRLIDRPIRPLFPNGYMNEVQVICTVIGADKNENADIAALIGASAALAISGIPFESPIGAIRVGHIDDKLVVNPTYSDLTNSRLDMVVAATADAVIMVESEAKQLSEEVMLEAVNLGLTESAKIVDNINQLVEQVGRQKTAYEPDAVDQQLVDKIEQLAATDITHCYETVNKVERIGQLKTLRNQVVDQFEEEQQSTAGDLFGKLEKKIVREKILSGAQRIDGRDFDTVRPISVEVGLLEQTHGSALFTRGETQALVVATIGTEKEGQIIDAIEGESKSPFMLHYNFPPYSVGECGRTGSPGRREIGHGMLAKRGINAVMPDFAELGRTLRIVSEITESNGSSSMATVCGTSLALMDAGFPVADAVAGVAMGLVKDGDKYQVLTDILGDEDHLGDMDFKVAGTQTGVTALQMDIKVNGITSEIMQVALEKAHNARIHILTAMNAVIDKPRESMSKHVPQRISFKIPKPAIKVVIGKGGATIKSIIQDTGVKIDIQDSGQVFISGTGVEAIEKAQQQIEDIIQNFKNFKDKSPKSHRHDKFDRKPVATDHLKVGENYTGRVSRIVDFGAFVEFDQGGKGLLHTKNITDQPFDHIEDIIQLGQDIEVKILSKEGSRINLSTKF